MKNKSILYLAVICLIALCSCKCPELKLFCKFQRHNKQDYFKITDIKTGTGKTRLEKETIEFDKDKNEKLTVSYDVTKYTLLKVGADKYFWMRADIAIKDSKGRVIAVKPAIADIKDKIANKPFRFEISLDLNSSKDIVSGSYSLDMFVTDMIGLSSDKRTVYFKVK